MSFAKYCFIVAILLAIAPKKSVAQTYNPITVEVARSLSQEILGRNSEGFLTPLVTTSNAATNSRFYRSAEVRKKNQLYFRFGVQTMTGFVRDDQKEFTPVPPTITNEEITAFMASQFANISLGRPMDTAGIVVNSLKYMITKGLADPNSGVAFPQSAATVFGNRNEQLSLNSQYFLNQLTSDPLMAAVYTQLSDEQQGVIRDAISGLPSNFPMPTGGNISQVFILIPQLEIGSFYGTELLLRYIPPIKVDKNIGEFSFWGIGLKHSVSQYFESMPFELAAQGVYQSTNLQQIVGVTQAELTADANIMSANLHASKKFEKLADLVVYTGLSYDRMTVNSQYKYTLPVTMQYELKLLKQLENGEFVKDPPEFPGDEKPQTAKGTYTDSSMKWTVGAAKSFGMLSIALDYSISRFNMLSFGVDVEF